MQGKRKDQIEFASKMAMGAIIGMLAVLIIAILTNSVVRGDRVDPNKTYGPSHNYEIPWLDGTERTALDTMRAIIPNGKGVITYEDGSADSIRWSEANEWPEEKITRGVSPDPVSSDEYHMWITNDGDTIWE